LKNNEVNINKKWNTEVYAKKTLISVIIYKKNGKIVRVIIVIGI